MRLLKSKRSGELINIAALATKSTDLDMLGLDLAAEIINLEVLWPVRIEVLAQSVRVSARTDVSSLNRMSCLI